MFFKAVVLFQTSDNQEKSGSTPFTREMDCDQTVMGLPFVTSAVFLIAKSFW
jgi:hypothetical protein